MRRTVLLLASMAVAMLLACGVALALPSGTPDKTPMVNGTVRAIEQVGTNIWLGGKFTQVKQCSNPNKPTLNVSNLAVIDSNTNECKNFPLPTLGGTGSEVWDMTLYGQDVLIAGKFSSGSSSTQKNLVLVNGKSGDVIRWYNSPSLKSVLAAPDLGRVYGGGVSLTAFDKDSGTKVWTKAKTTVNTTRYPDAPSPGYRDLELDGQTIWAACACDAVGGKAAKVLVKLRATDGEQDTSWLAQADPASWGMSLVEDNGALYLGAGGSDYLAKYDKTGEGSRSWRRDTSGSVQVVEVMDSQLVIGGHFWEVADEPTDPTDACGHRSGGNQNLDPNDQCQTRKGIAAYSFSGGLDPDWDPMYAGKYSLVWALHVDGAKLHTGGEFLTVNGVTQNYYARLSPTSIKGDEKPNALAGTPNSDTIYGYGGADRIDARGGDDTLRLGGGKDKGRGGRGDDFIRGVDGSKDQIFCGPGADRVKANPGDHATKGCEKVTRVGKRVG